MGKSRKEEILAAFERLVGRFGLDKVTMQDLAREAGISVGAIYLDFKNKDALVAAIEEKWRGHVAHRREIFVHRPEGHRPPLTAIENVMLPKDFCGTGPAREEQTELSLE